MKNYDVVAVEPALREQIEARCRWLDSRHHARCGICGSTSYGAAVCSRCRDACPHTNHVIPGWVRRSNGTRQAFRRCLHCGLMLGSTLGAIPRGGRVLDVCLRDSTSPVPCERCGTTTGVELHHWAPRNTFGQEEADLWPTSYLCRAHHQIWHQTMDGYRWNNRAAS